jgi:hypothetical protein
MACDQVYVSNIDRIENAVDGLERPNRHRIVFDRGYGSLSLAEALTNDYGCEYVMKCARNRPAWLFGNCLSTDLELNEYRTAFTTLSNQHIVALSFFEERDERGLLHNFLSNCHGSALQQGIPSVLVDYNQNFRYVDLFNQLVLGNMDRHRHKRWQLALLSWLITATAQNARVIFNRLSGNNDTLRDFQRNLAEELSPDADALVHQLEHMPTKKHCRMCSRHGRRSNTTLCCPACFRHPALHKDCFNEWHEQFE